MIELHAPDRMGKAANDAALALHLMDFRLLCAASPTLSREERAEAVRKALRQWPVICRAMSELGMAAPGASLQAEADDQQMRDWIEGRAP